jgi:aspartyl-tRNA(Asn)/glutamyl-tRNA(Gln) amidotransferase subunit B
MRSKEEAHDYRYFPEPDLSPLDLTPEWIDGIRGSLPELPEARKVRFVAAYGLSDYDADVIVRTMAGSADYFEATVKAGAPAKAASNWIQGEIRRRLKDAGSDDVAQVPVTPERLAELVILTDRGVVSSTVAKDVFDRMWTSGGRAKEIIEEQSLDQIGDESALAGLVAAVIQEHPGPAAQYRAGRTNTFGFLVGQVMKASQGKANPRIVSELLKKALTEQ